MSGSGAEAPEVDVRRIVEEARGHPLFLEELSALLGDATRSDRREQDVLAEAGAGARPRGEASGAAAEAGGALFVGLIAYAVGIAPLWIVASAGFAGALIDSILGASLQALYYCARCQRRCETDPHVCGNATSPVRGVRWIDNDAVNAFATLAGAAAAGSLAAVYLTAF